MKINSVMNIIKKSASIFCGVVDGAEWDISAWVDKASGEVSIAVKAGFLVLGYIAPTNIKTDFIAMDLALLTETLKRQKEIEATLVGDYEEDYKEL